LKLRSFGGESNDAIKSSLEVFHRVLLRESSLTWHGKSFDCDSAGAELEGLIDAH
jgi:hypothetical protein